MEAEPKGVRLRPDQVLELIPQRPPFRFVDEILDISETRVVGRYTFRQQEYFYQGHFPGKPITPGVILMECMAQVSVVALGLFNVALEVPLADISSYFTVAAEMEAEFFKPVLPGDSVFVEAQRVYWRRMKLKSTARMTLMDGSLVATGSFAGIGVKSERL